MTYYLLLFLQNLNIKFKQFTLSSIDIRISVNRTVKQQDDTITITATVIETFSRFNTTHGSTLQLTQSTDSVLCKCRHFIPHREYIVMGHFKPNHHTQPVVNLKSLVSKWTPTWRQKLKKMEKRPCDDVITAL